MLETRETISQRWHTTKIMQYSFPEHWLKYHHLLDPKEASEKEALEYIQFESLGISLGDPMPVTKPTEDYEI
jgi:hypothetical protein